MKRQSEDESSCLKSLCGNIKLLESLQNEYKSLMGLIKNEELLGSVENTLVECSSSILSIKSQIVAFQHKLSVGGNTSSEAGNEFELDDTVIVCKTAIRNRTAVRKLMRDYMAELYVPLELIESIENYSPSEQRFVEFLHELSGKYQLVAAFSSKGYVSSHKVLSTLNELCLKACKKIKSYLNAKLELLAKPSANYHIVQTFLCSSHFFYEFLQVHSNIDAEHLLLNYHSTMQNLYYMHFKKLTKTVEKTVERQFFAMNSKKYLIGNLDDENFARSFSFKDMAAAADKGKIFNSFLSLGSNKNNVSSKNSGYYNDKLNLSLSFFDFDAEKFLFLTEKSFDFVYINQLIAVTNKKLFTLSQSFAIVFFMLLNNLNVEEKFICEFFFSPAETSRKDAVMQSVFGKTLLLIKKFFDNIFERHVVGSYDMIEYICCIGYLNQIKLVIQTNKDSTVNTNLIELLTSLENKVIKYFSELFSLNIDSLSKNNEPFKNSTPNILVHPATKKTCSVLYSLLFVNCLTASNFIIDNYINNLILAYYEFVNNCENCLKIPNDKYMFCMNNYGYMYETVSRNMKQRVQNLISKTDMSINEDDMKKMPSERLASFFFELENKMAERVQNLVMDQIELHFQVLCDCNNSNKSVDENAVKEFQRSFEAKHKNTLFRIENYLRNLFHIPVCTKKCLEGFYNRFLQMYTVYFEKNKHLFDTVNENFDTVVVTDTEKLKDTMFEIFFS